MASKKLTPAQRALLRRIEGAATTAWGLAQEAEEAKQLLEDLVAEAVRTGVEIEKLRLTAGIGSRDTVYRMAVRSEARRAEAS